MKFKPFMLGAVASTLALSAVVAGCGGDDDDDEPTSAVSTAATTAAGSPTGGAASPTGSGASPTGGAQSGDDEEQIRETATRIAGASGDNPQDVEFYLEHSSDEFIEALFPEGRAACQANAAECIRPLTNPTIAADGVEIDGDNADVTVTSEEGAFLIKMVKDDDVWKANQLSAASDDVPDGTERVAMDMVEFAFEFDADSEALASGEFAFELSNSGEQTHEAVLAKIPDTGALEEILQSEDESQFQFIGVKAPVAPDDELDWAVPPLEPGRYAIVCFLPDTEDPEGTPHAFKGMASEFTVE